MIKLKRKNIISLTNNKAKRIVAIALAVIFSIFLVSVINDKMFDVETVSNPAYHDNGATPRLSGDFCFEQQFTPSHSGLKLFSINYRNDVPLDGTNIFHIDIADEKGTTVASMSRALITNSGDYKMNIVLNGIKLSANETYTLKITPGVGFDDNAVRLLTAVSNSSETGDSSYNGMVQDDHASLIMVFRYEYFALSYYLLCWALAFLACAILVFHINLGPKLTMAFNILMALAMPVTAFAIVEWLNFGNILNLWVMHGFLNLIWYFMVYAIIFAMFNSLRISLVFGTIIFFVCGLINHFTILFRGTTVLPSDILAAGTALKVFEKYQFNLSLVIVCSFFILLCLVQLAARTNFRLPGLKPRLIMCGSVALVTITFVSIFMNTAFLDSVGLTPYQWKQTKACRDRGFIANFTSNIPSLIVKKPVGYNANKLTSILDDEDKLLQDTKSPDEFLNVNAAPDGKKPNIIAIMNESLADFNFQGDLKTDKDPLRFIHSLDENVIKGKLAMPVFGAGTSNSEFEFLTGNSVSFLPFGCVPYQQFVEQDAESLVSTMMGQGYSSVALHPYNPDGWARTTVYKDFEFEEFISEGAFANAEKLRWYISDQSNFEMLETLYERRDTSKPFFAFNVTMQNHGGYDFSPFTPTVALQGYNNDYPDVEQYLSMAKASDAAFEKLTEYFKNVDEPTIICMFGDHLPKVSEAFYAELMGDKLPEGENISDIYQSHLTPFIIWANYDLGTSIPDFGTISANYLSSLLLGVANAEMPAYNEYLFRLMQKVPVLSSSAVFGTDSPMTFKSNTVVADSETYKTIDPDDEKGEFYDLLQNYKILQYNNIIDNRNRDESIFFINGNSEN